MSIKICIENIIDFKQVLSSKYNIYGRTIGDIEYFIQLLTAPDIIKLFPDLAGVKKKNKTYLNSYFHACLISVFMEKEGYSLENWLKYSEHIAPVLQSDPVYSQYLTKFTEDDVFEYFILHTVNNTFSLCNIIALKTHSKIKHKNLYDDYLNDEVLPQLTTDKILAKVKISMKIRGNEEKKIWGDNDILIVAYPQYLHDAEVICIISCKTSLRERVYQSIFWATHSRIEGIAKHTFATLDKGDTKGNTEIGHRGANNLSRKTRDVLESTMDRVYTLRDPKDVNRSYVIKDFDYLEKDLNRWREDYFGL